MGNRDMVCRVIGIVLGLAAVVLTLWSLGTTKWSTSVPLTTSGMPISFQAHRGLWKQCYGSGSGDFNTQCNKYTQTITQLAKTGLVGQRALMCIATICAFAGLFTGITSSDAVNVAKTSGSKSKAAGGAASKIIKNNEYNYFPGANVGSGK